MSERRRLIEEFLPLRAIGSAGVTEKSGGRKFHISTLHTWWARRPLAAARAAVFATLVPAEESIEDLQQLNQFMAALCRWGGTEMYGAPKAPVAEARAQILKEHAGSSPKLLDCFSGGGAIPLEMARLGCQPHALELNPVAYLILLCTLVYPQKFGLSLADDVEKWGTWLVERSKSELGEFYPTLGSDSGQLSMDGRPTNDSAEIPIAYRWTRTVPCPNPQRPPHDLHLVRQTWVVKKPGKGGKPGRFVAFKPVVDSESLKVSYEVVEAGTPAGLGFDPDAGSKRGSATCRVCGAAVNADDVKTLGREGKIGRELMGAAIVHKGVRGKRYLGSSDAASLVADEREIQGRLRVLGEEGMSIPDTPLPRELTGGTCIPYGFQSVGDLFLERQLVSLLTFCKNVRLAHEEMLAGGMEEDRARAITTFLAMAVDRVAERGSSLCIWNSQGEKTEKTFGKQALPMVWDFSEVNPFGGASGDLAKALSAVADVIRHCSATGMPAEVIRGSAADPIEGGPFDAIITDPPYYDNISYADLSDFFYAWLQRSIGHLYPEHLSAPTSPKKKEIVAVSYRADGSDALAKSFYDDMMSRAFSQMKKVLKPDGLVVCVYAHKTYSGWATLISAMRNAGFLVVEAWPLDTERPGGLKAETASLASSIFLVARRRESDEGGDWAKDVYPNLKAIVSERVKKLPEMGVSGDDLMIAAIGAGLRAYTQFSRVELPNGQELSPDQYLEEVQREVIETILSDVFGLARSGIKSVDHSTQFYVMGRFEFGTSWAEFDRVNTLGKGIGIELTGARSLLKGAQALIVKDKDKVQFRDYQERGKSESLGLPDEDGNLRPLIDVLHRLLYLSQKEPAKVAGFLIDSMADADSLRLVAQALSGSALDKKGIGTSDRERNAIASLLGSWKRLVDDNLFRRGERS